MTEPKRLRRGKRFQRLVQSDFELNSKDGLVRREAAVDLVLKRPARKSKGRADILITELGDFVTILEIKATNWDKIKPTNIKKNLWRHQAQLYSYADRYLDIDNTSVCAGIIYPTRPRDDDLCKLIESYLESYGTPAYWYDEIATEKPGNAPDWLKELLET